jgi:histidinol dehydrogenase
MLRKFDVASARETILKRVPPDDLAIPESVLKRTEQLFGEPLTPPQAVDRILKDVRKRGDAALIEWTQRLDGVTLEKLLVEPELSAKALSNLSREFRSSLELATQRIRKFHECQPIHSWMTQALGGTVGQYVRPIKRVGLYIPAGTAPLPSTLMMTAIPAQVAGVSEIVLTTPPNRKTGQVDPCILAVAEMLGIKEIIPIGGAQAIAALAYGTQTIRPVDKIFGPGNLFVTLAKRQVYGVVGIDSLAGPTETMVIADNGANPEWVAADLIAQAEHDVVASSILLTTSDALIAKVQAEIERQVASRSRRNIIEVAMDNRSGAVLCSSLDEALELANEYGPEHLCLAVKEPWGLAEKVTSAGGIFVGEHSFEVLGDYIAGPSHVMPTGGTARFSSPLNVLDFIHVISLIALNPETTRQIAGPAAMIAHAEGLDGHANAAEVRL